MNVIQIEINGNRYYKYNDQLKISVTRMMNVLSKGIGFRKWLGNSESYKKAMQYANMKGDKGEKVHDDIATELKGGKVIINDMESWRKKRIQSFRKFMDKYNPTIIGVEETLAKKDLPYAGTTDSIFKINDKNIIVDWKTGNCYKTHELQISAYKYLSNLHIDELWLQRLTNWKTSNVYLPEPKRIKPVDKDLLNSIYDIWKYKNDGKRLLKTAYKKLENNEYEITN